MQIDGWDFNIVYTLIKKEVFKGKFKKQVHTLWIDFTKYVNFWINLPWYQSYLKILNYLITSYMYNYLTYTLYTKFIQAQIFVEKKERP